MYKGTSATMQRLAIGGAGSSHQRLPRVSGPITDDEQQEFGIPGASRDELLDGLSPVIRRLRGEGHQSTKALSAKLNSEGCRTALDRHWSPRLVGFLIGFLGRRGKRRKAQAEADRQAQDGARRSSKLPPANSKTPLTVEEVARRNAAVARMRS
jgi:hypothetical protein